MNDKKYNQFSRHLESVFGQKVYKITLDAGFSCPNRDGTISYGGCIFCDESGSFSQCHDNLLPIEKQLETGIIRQRKRFKANKFISYFQAFSNTYASVEHLKTIYDSALSHEDIAGMSIGTRPDCVDEEKIDLISSYTDKYYVWIEYGLQSIHDRTLKLINRGHTYQDFVKAVELTQNKGINICTHVIIGLPGETREDLLMTAKAISDLGINGVKIHAYCALKGTKLAQMYENGEFAPLAEDEYVNLICDFLEVLPPETTIHRLAGNGLLDLLVAPRWLDGKFRVLTHIDNELEKRNSYQGKFFKSITSI